MNTYIVCFSSKKQFVICGNDIDHAVENNWEYIVKGISGTGCFTLKHKYIERISDDKYELVIEYYPLPQNRLAAHDTPPPTLTRHVKISCEGEI